MPGVAEVVAWLGWSGVHQGVCTNKPRATTEQILAHFGLVDSFAIVVGADSTPAKKSDPRPMRAALEGLGVEADEAVIIGDSAADVAAARAVEMPVILTSFGYSDRPLRDLGADAVVDRLAQLPAALSILTAARLSA